MGSDVLILKLAIWESRELFDNKEEWLVEVKNARVVCIREYILTYRITIIRKKRV